MKRYFVITAILISVAVFFSCSREFDFSLDKVSSGIQMKEITITATVESDPDTRTYLQDNQVYWQPGDKISVFYGSGDNGGSPFTSTNMANSLSADFSGTLGLITGSGDNDDEEAGARQFWGVYPYRDDIVCDGTTITTTLPDVQTAVEGTFDRDLFISMGRSPGLDIRFLNVCSGIKFTVSHPDICQIVFSGNAGETLAGRVKIGFDEDGMPEVKQVVDGKKTVTVNAPNGGTFEVGKTYYLVIFPVTMSASMKMSFIKTDMTSGLRKWSTASIQFKRKIWKNYIPIDADDKTTFFEAVDLGGSVLWATKNVGAAEVGDYGDYYNWGDTSPYNGGATSASIVAKYESSGSLFLEPEDDAATANWGGYWRMPTAAELAELQAGLEDATLTAVKVTENEKSGIRVTAVASGNSIILPLSGLCWPTQSGIGVDRLLSLLSSEKYPESSQIKVLNCTSTANLHLIDGSIEYGFSVRPVLSKPVAATTVVLNKTSVRMSMWGTEQLTATVLPENAFRKGVIWSSSDENIAAVTETGLVKARNIGYVTIYATSMDGAATATCDVHVIMPESTDWVEMGPGHIWATCNVGAELPTDAGDLFAWAETEPKETYSWVNYRWLTPTYITKYQVPDENWNAIWYQGIEGFVGDGKTILDSEDDAATVKLGDDWHTPTEAEWSWLLANCSTERTTQGGVPGVRFTSLVEGYTNASIFLPSGTNGSYWSSSLNLDKTEEAYAVWTNGLIALFSQNTREHGYMVRPVYSPMVHVTEVSLDQSYLEMPEIGQTQTLTATVSPANATEAGVIWSSSNPAVATVSSDGVVTSVTYGTTTITVKSVDGLKSASCEVFVTGHIFVEMGPGQYWATCNLGATLPEETGNRYAWGETAPKNDYFWPTYTLSNGDALSINKYQFPDGNLDAVWYNNGYFTGDGFGVLKPEDDAAHVAWNTPWHIPTRSDWEWLQNNCSWVWDSAKNGYWVTSQVAGYDNRQIFLPGSGAYWSSTVNGLNSSTAHVMNAEETNQGMDIGERYLGNMIRPVNSPVASVTSVSLDKSSLTIGGTVGPIQTLTATISPSNASEKGLVWTSSNPAIATVSTSGVVEALSTGTTTITVTTLDGKKTASCEVTVNWSGQINGHAWVDMGSGLKWATSNYGSDTAQYTWWQSRENLTSWGDGWRTPTWSEWQWLIDNCTWERGDGYEAIVTSPITHKSITLPCVGYIDDENVSHTLANAGYYWTANTTLFGGSYGLAFGVIGNPFWSKKEYPTNYSLSVRPVHN